MDEITMIRENSTSYLTFNIGEETFAIHVAHISSIIEVPRITEVPNTPDYIRGVLNLGHLPFQSLTRV